MQGHIHHHTHFEALLGEAPLVIADLWGVVHDGVKALPDAVDCLIKTREAGVPVALLSNAPKPVSFVKSFIESIGVTANAYDMLVTSGSIARDHVRDEFSGKKLFHLGPLLDHITVEGLPVELVSSPDSADVILATGLQAEDGPSHAEMLRGAAEAGILMLVANPDRVVHIGDDLMLCAGVVGDCYEALGGPVHWCGKPMREAFETCAERLTIPFASLQGRAIMVGDSLKTDIAGAEAAGINSVLIAGGIHRGDALFDKGGDIAVDIFRKTYGDSVSLPANWMRQLSW